MLHVNPYFLPSLIAKLPTLTGLFLYNVTFRYPRPHEFPESLPANARLKQLYISGHTEASPVPTLDLSFLVRSFPCTCSIAFRGVTLIPGDNHNTIKRSPQPNLKELRFLDSHNSSLLLRGLQRTVEHRHFPALTTLAIGRLRMEDMQPLLAVLAIVSSQLLSLHLQYNLEPRT